MSPPADPCAIDVDVGNVLWVTRDEDHEYACLLLPVIAMEYDWHQILRRIFLVVPTTQPQHVAGTFSIEGLTTHYVATVFLDPARLDARDRPVAHRLVWFPPDGVIPASVPADWGPCLVAALAPAYDLVFKVIRDRNRMLEIAYQEALALGPRFHMVGPAVATRGRRNFVIWPDELPSRPGDQWRPLVTWLLFWSGTFALIALVVFFFRHWK